MATYQIEFKRTSYITLTIEADDRDAAWDAAWREIEHGRADINDAQWEVEGIEEIEK